MVDKETSFEDLRKMFPEGMKFSIKNPYLTVSLSGMLHLRNDNPENIMYADGSVGKGNQKKTNQQKWKMINSGVLKDRGNGFFKKGEYEQAIKYFVSALEQLEDEKQRIVILSNMAQCYINLGLFEDALKLCNIALKLNPDHPKTLYRKGRCLAYLFEFQQSIAIYEHLRFQKDINFVNEL